MIENTENTAPAEQGATATPATPAELVIADLKAQVAQLERERDWARDARDHNGKKLDQVREYIQASIDNGDWEDSELEEIFWEELADKLDLEIKKTVEVYITTQWSATVKIPRSKTIDDIAEDLKISEPEADWSSVITIESIFEDDTTVTEA
jgi:N-methylhydantoinase B/oxoprolinase/acetone carboxylase alpha subunit